MSFQIDLSIIFYVGVVFAMGGIAVILLRFSSGLKELMISIGHYSKTLESLKSTVEKHQHYGDQNAQKQRQEINQNIQGYTAAVLKQMTEIATLQKNLLDSFSKQLTVLTGSNESRLDTMRKSISDSLKSIQEDNTKKLEQMRQTVDEKLHATLEKRLSASFNIVGERLELVHKGLGEMQALASGVGDLKRVLTNVKTRGTWGEVQLGALLEQVLTPEQYETNVVTIPGSSERVEYALKLPGQGHDKSSLWLPIDAKFPIEAFHKLHIAQDNADTEGITKCVKDIETEIKKEAKAIQDKYISPPHTTDFAILFLPIEGLYAEVLKHPELSTYLQQKYRIMIAGPTTLCALLNSLQMGFRTLAIEKRSGEVWRLLSTVKNEFGKFGDLLDKTHKKLQEASNSIDQASAKSRNIASKLRKVETLPTTETPMITQDLSKGTPLLDPLEQSELQLDQKEDSHPKIR